MVKKTKPKGNAKKPAARAAARPHAAPQARTKTPAKYDQPGAPWWKKAPLPDVR